eukprot:PhM_4_TR4786/c0_g1_i1/m.58950
MSGIGKLIAPYMRIRALKRPPPQGYTVFHLSNGTELKEYLTEYSKKVSIVVLYEKESEAMLKNYKKFICQAPLGSADDVTIAYLPTDVCPRTVWENERVLGLPASLIYYDKKCVGKVIGIRPNELSVKSRFVCRNAGLNPCGL